MSNVGNSLICAALTSKSVEDMIKESFVAKEHGANVVELRLDHILNFDPINDLKTLLSSSALPAIVTYR